MLQLYTRSFLGIQGITKETNTCTVHQFAVWHVRGDLPGKFTQMALFATSNKETITLRG